MSTEANPAQIAVEFLKRIYPAGPWVLTAIHPDGGPPITQSFTASTEASCKSFIRAHNGTRNLYYSVNEPNGLPTKKSTKKDINRVHFLHVDIDPEDNETSDAAKQRILVSLQEYPLTPTEVVNSGNGIQLLFRLETPIAADEASIRDIEARNYALALAFKCDPCTRNIDRIFRLPGTENLPNAKKKRVGRTDCGTGVLEFKDVCHPLSAFAQHEDRAPKTQSSVGTEAKPEDLRLVPQVVNELPVSPRIKKLMMGIDDPNHSYPSRSERVMAVLTAMARADCSDAQMHGILDLPIGAHVRDQRNPKQYLAKQIEAARQFAARKAEEIRLSDPLATAQIMLRTGFSDSSGTPTVRRYRGTFWQWSGSHFSQLSDEDMEMAVWSFLREAQGAEREARRRLRINRSRVADIVAALKSLILLPGDLELPCWIDDEDHPLPSELFACKNGLLHLEKGELQQASVRFFNMTASEVAFDPKAPEPLRFLSFLQDLFGDDAEAAASLQEWFGYCLSADTSAQKMLLLIGPKRGGKGTIARVLRSLLGPNSVAGPTMASLSAAFGLEPLITKSLAVISDARVGGKTDKSAIMERLLSISGEDALSVDRKFKEAWHGKLGTRIMMLTNELPSFSDGSGALSGRFIVLNLTNSFFGKEDPDLMRKLTEELSGILNWAIEGYRRLRERGRFQQPASGKEALDEIEMLGSPVKAFIRDECQVHPGGTVTVTELWNRYCRWAIGEGIKQPGTKTWFGRNLRSALPGIVAKKLGPNDGRELTYVGISLIPDEARPM